MKNFKSYLTEVFNNEDEDDDGISETQRRREEAHDNIAEILSDLHGKSHIPHPHPSRTDTIGLFYPRVNIYEGGRTVYGDGVSGKMNRRYRWENWHNGLNALAIAMVHQDHAMGNLSGNREGRELSNDEIDSNRNMLRSRFNGVVDGFRAQHEHYLTDLHGFHPEIRKNIDVLQKLGERIPDINKIQFDIAINTHLVGHQMALLRRVMADESVHHLTQNMLTKANNKAVSLHNHPLGLMLSGGAQPMIGPHLKPIVEEPHPTDPHGWVDISHKYEH